jgi:hypothetical protein
MKQSKIKKLTTKKSMERYARHAHADGDHLERFLRREGAATIAKMRAKGYDLVSCLATGEGVFVREDHVVGLHIQLPAALYRRLDRECRQQGVTKRSFVVTALERSLPTAPGEASSGE